MSGKFTFAKLILVSVTAGLVPCMASAVNMPEDPMTERVDATHLGESQEGVTLRSHAGWAVQVGAYADKDKAEALLEKLAASRPGELRHAERLVTSLKWDDAHTLYRARFAGFSLQEASGICANLNGAGQACFLSQDDDVADGAKASARDAAVAPLPHDQPDSLLLKDAPAMLVASTAALKDALVAVPDFSIVEDPPAKAMTPKLLALNDKLAADQAGRISNDELSGMRGGFFTAAGAQFDFGASIRTMVNGQLALQTNLTWTPQGPNIASLAGLGQQIVNQVQSNLAQAGIGTPPASSLAPTAPTAPTVTNAPVNNPVADVVNAANNAATVPAVTGNPVGAANGIASAASNLATGAASSALNGLANAAGNGPAAPAAPTTPQTTITIPTLLSGVNIPSPGGGSTQVLANISATQIQNIILNSANNQTINQNTNVTLTIYNLQQWQQQLAQHALSAQLANEVMTLTGLGR